MTFVYPLLLGGLALVGIPVLLHLIMRQKPKHLPFPAVRFLLQRKRTNQRRLQLRHLLLLAMRMLLLAAICLALARPKIFNERFFSTERPEAAVLVFDTSSSMEYSSGGQTRLEEAKRRALELLAELPPGSRVAVFDTAEAGGEWLPSISQARERINDLELRPANYPVTAQLTPAYELLAKLDEETDNPDEAPVRFLYVFSDRTRACWNASHLENLQRIRDRLPPPGVRAVFVDVGVDSPATVAITGLELPSQVIPANKEILIRATVQATGTRCDTEISCKIDDQEPVDRKPVTLEAGQAKVITFQRRGLSQGMHQAEVSLASRGALPFACVRYATFEVQRPRKVLTIVDDVHNARIWKIALESSKAFECDLISTADARNHLFPNDLAKYQAVCLLGLARPDKDLWDKLGSRYVRDGGGLAIIPGGDDVERGAYNTETAQALMPATLEKIVQAADKKKGAVWSAASYQHPLMAPFGEWSKEENVDFLAPGFEPFATRYWEVKPRPNNESFVIVSYDEKREQPALVERSFDRQKVRGRVLLFTTPLDDGHVTGKDAAGRPAERWNSYLQNTSFYLVLAQKTVGYLAGDAEGGNFNYQCGQPVPVPVPADQRSLTYTVQARQGPGLSSADATVSGGDDQGELQITKVVTPGNFRLFNSRDKESREVAAFSLNVPAEECQLARVPPEEIEALFGPGALLPLDHKTSLHDALQNHWSQPVELLPWLMLFVLLALVVENLLANKFYRKEPAEDEAEKSEPAALTSPSQA